MHSVNELLFVLGCRSFTGLSFPNLGGENGAKNTQGFSTLTMRIAAHGVYQFCNEVRFLASKTNTHSVTHDGGSYDYFSSQLLIVPSTTICPDPTHLHYHVPPHTVRLSGLAMFNHETRMHRPSPGTPSGDLRFIILSPLYDSIFFFFSLLFIFSQKTSLTP